jgi:hypothetical protein
VYTFYSSMKNQGTPEMIKWQEDGASLRGIGPGGEEYNLVQVEPDSGSGWCATTRSHSGRQEKIMTGAEQEGAKEACLRHLHKLQAQGAFAAQRAEDNSMSPTPPWFRWFRQK